MNKKQYEKPVMRIVEQRLTTYLQNASMQGSSSTKQRYTNGNQDSNGAPTLSEQIWGND